MDGTLIKTKSGLVFPKDYDDWQLLYVDVPNKLKELYKNSYKIVIFTNQASIGSGKVNINSFKNKLKNIVQRIGVPMQVYFVIELYIHTCMLKKTVLHINLFTGFYSYWE